MATQHYWVAGRVQGVGYRAATAAKARELGLTGWVRNSSDGRVEAEATGDEESLEAFLAWLEQGPAPATVDRVDAAACSHTAFAAFTIRANG